MISIPFVYKQQLELEIDTNKDNNNTITPSLNNKQILIKINYKINKYLTIINRHELIQQDIINKYKNINTNNQNKLKKIIRRLLSFIFITLSVAIIVILFCYIFKRQITHNFFNNILNKNNYAIYVVGLCLYFYSILACFKIIFKLKIKNIYGLYGNKQSEKKSIFIAAMYFSTFTYSFINIINLIIGFEDRTNFSSKTNWFKYLSEYSPHIILLIAVIQVIIILASRSELNILNFKLFSKNKFKEVKNRKAYLGSLLITTYLNNNTKDN